MFVFVKPNKRVFVVGGSHSTYTGRGAPGFIGRGHQNFGKVENPTMEDHLREAILGAFADTGTSPEHIDKGYVGNFLGELFVKQGQTGALIPRVCPGLDGWREQLTMRRNGSSMSSCSHTCSPARKSWNCSNRCSGGRASRLFSITEVQLYEAMGFAPCGEGLRLLKEGVTELNGRLPVNTGGGLIAFGHPVGATGVKQVSEVHRQLKGKCGAYQAPNGPRIGLSANIGGDDRTAVVILQRVAS